MCGKGQGDQNGGQWRGEGRELCVLPTLQLGRTLLAAEETDQPRAHSLGIGSSPPHIPAWPGATSRPSACRGQHCSHGGETQIHQPMDARPAPTLPAICTPQAGRCRRDRAATLPRTPSSHPCRQHRAGPAGWTAPPRSASSVLLSREPESSCPGPALERSAQKLLVLRVCQQGSVTWTRL